MPTCFWLGDGYQWYSGFWSGRIVRGLAGGTGYGRLQSKRFPSIIGGDCGDEQHSVNPRDQEINKSQCQWSTSIQENRVWSWIMQWNDFDLLSCSKGFSWRYPWKQEERIISSEERIRRFWVKPYETVWRRDNSKGGQWDMQVSFRNSEKPYKMR